MKIPVHPSNSRRSGMVVIIILILLAMVLLYISANLRALSTLGREIQLINQKQIRRLTALATNAAPVSPDMTGTNSPAVISNPR